MSSWKDKVVLITGASAGLGCAIAAAYARNGAKLVLAARGTEALEAAAESLRNTGAKVLAVPTDITDTAQVESLISQAVAKFGQLDVLVNCAGKSDRGAVADVSAEQFAELLELNFLGTVRCTKAALPHLLEAKGSIINVGSLAAKTAPRFLGAYPASKFPVAAYSQQLRLELGEQGLHVLLVCPGPIARDDAGQRYDKAAADLPESARQPGGGAKVKAIRVDALADRILLACKRRQPELLIPGYSRWLFALAQLSPRLGDWILKRKTSS